MRVKGVFAISFGIFLLLDASVALFSDSRVLKTGEGVNVCGAIIAQCMKRCGEREKQGRKGMEYVQITITFGTSDTKCATAKTEENEIVSSNPPNDDHEVVVFNVPCCQQRPFLPVSVRIGQPELETPQPKSTTTSSTTVSTSTTSSTTQERTKEPEFISIKDNLLLVFIILCFIFVLFIMVIMLWKLAKKRRKKTLKTGSESSPVTTSTSNGAILVGVTNEKSPRKEQRGGDVETKAVESDESPRMHFERRSSGQPSSNLREDMEMSSDYIRLDTAEPTTMNSPKSAKSSNRSESKKPEEVLVIGAGRRVVQGSSEKYPVSNGYVPNFHQNHEAEDDNDVTESFQTNVASKTITIQPQLPGRNSDKPADLHKYRAESIPGTLELSNESDYDKLGASLTNNVDDIDSEIHSFVKPERAQSDLKLGMGAASLDPNSIYNVLRGDETADVGSDYQSLKRIEPNKLKPYDDVGEPLTSYLKNSKSFSMRDVEDGYVQDFQIINSLKTPVGDTRTVSANDYAEHLLPRTEILSRLNQTIYAVSHLAQPKAKSKISNGKEETDEL